MVHLVVCAAADLCTQLITSVLSRENTSFFQLMGNIISKCEFQIVISNNVQSIQLAKGKNDHEHNNCVQRSIDSELLDKWQLIYFLFSGSFSLLEWVSMPCQSHVRFRKGMQCPLIHHEFGNIHIIMKKSSCDCCVHENQLEILSLQLATLQSPVPHQTMLIRSLRNHESRWLRGRLTSSSV